MTTRFRPTLTGRGRHAPHSLRLETLEDRLALSGLVGNLVTFGDSLSNVGNAALATGGAIPGPLYFQGRFSSGPIWIDTLAEYLGKPTVRPSLAGGLDYAFGGATLAYHNTQPPFGGVPTVPQQVGQYLSAHQPAGDDVFVLLGGANDLFDSLGQQGVPIDPTLSANALLGAISNLSAAGARRFVVADLPPLGQVPYFQDFLKAGFISQAQIDGINQWTAAYDFFLNTGLTLFGQSHPGETVVAVDTAGLFAKFVQPSNPFAFTNVTNAVGPYGSGNGGLLTAITAADPGGYLFFDSVHPGTRAQQALGLTAAAQTYAALGVNALTVTNVSDAIDPLDGGLSLREALALANAEPGRQTVRFVLGNGTQEIRLAGQQLEISDDVSIVGPGAERLIVSGAGASRLFTVDHGAAADLSGLTLRDGKADHGGAVFNAGRLDVSGVLFVGNRAEGGVAQGGAIDNAGVLTARHSGFVGNTAAGSSQGVGGAIAAEGSFASVELLAVLIADNVVSGQSAFGGGLAILDGASLRISDGLLLGNLARGDDARGGGIYAGAGTSLCLDDSLVTGNLAVGSSGGKGHGGGVDLADGIAFRRHKSVIAGNFATTSGWNLFEE